VVRNAPRAVTRQGFMPDCGRPARGVPKGVTVPAFGDTRRSVLGRALYDRSPLPYAPIARVSETVVAGIVGA
jgi:hypothetical protein